MAMKGVNLDATTDKIADTLLENEMTQRLKKGTFSILPPLHTPKNQKHYRFSIQTFFRACLYT